MKLTLQIQMDNAAFDDGQDGQLETARILERLARDLRECNGGIRLPLIDYNGNKVGKVNAPKCWLK